jgi:hypothetical protein
MPFDCGVPRELCSGAVVQCQKSVREGYKAHGDMDSAKRCARKYAQRLTAEGGQNGPIHLPSKPLRLKPGKHGEGGNRAKRFIVPTVRG